MGYKIKDAGLRKIRVPIVCKFGEEKREFANGAILAETVFDQPYEVDDVTVIDGQILVYLVETEACPVNEQVNRIGEEAVGGTPQYEKNEKWVKAHIEQFGKEPDFF